MPADTDFRVHLARRWCRECGANYQPRQASQHYCSQRCRAAWHNRWTRWGKQLVEAVFAWRLDRAKGGWSLITQAASDIVAEERDRRRRRQARIDQQKAARGYDAPAPTAGRRALADVLPVLDRDRGPTRTGDRAA